MSLIRLFDSGLIPSTPPSSYTKLFLLNGDLHQIDDAGVVTDLTESGLTSVDLGVALSAVQVEITNDSGTNAIIPLADLVNSGAAAPGVNSSALSAVQSVVAGLNITVDNTDPQNPIVSSIDNVGVETVTGGAGVTVDNTDPANPVVSSPEAASAVQSVVAGTNVTVDNSDPQNPIVSATDAVGVETVTGGVGVTVDNADPANPVVSSPEADSALQAVNLGATVSPTLVTVTNDAGTDANIPLATDTNAGAAAPGVNDAALSAVQSVVAGANVSVDDTDPQNPIVSATPGGQTLYDGTDTAANIQAMDPLSFIGQHWFATDEYIPYEATLAPDGVTAVWQSYGVIYDGDLDAYNLPTTLDGHTLNLGEENVIRVINETTTATPASVAEVMLVIGQSADPRVKNVVRPIASDLQEGGVYGITTTALAANGGIGRIQTLGDVNGINTSAWMQGQVLYVDPAVPGALTNVQPDINAFNVAVVTNVDAINGQIYVNTAAANQVDSVVVPGTTNYLFMTGDEVNLAGTDFYLLLLNDEGAVLEATETVVAGDNQTIAAGQDFVTEAFTVPFTVNEGIREGQIEFSHNSNGAQERVYYELYEADADGNAVASSVPGAPVGTLGVEVIFIMVTGLLDNDANDIFKDEVKGLLPVDYTLPIGSRLRIRVLCEKVGTAGGNKTFTLYFGSDHDSFIQSLVVVPLAFTELTDTFDDYTGRAGQALVVNNTEDGVDSVDSFVKWAYPWLAGTYPNRTMTRIGDWTTISNKTTSAYPAPVLENTPSWGIVPDPTWTTSQATGDIAYGFDVTVQDDAMLAVQGWRIWLTGAADDNYTVQVYNYSNPNNPILLGSQYVEASGDSGWLEVISNNSEAIFYEGDRIRIIVLVHSDTNDLDFNGTWQNVDGGAVPPTGVVTLNTTAGTKVFINYNETNGGPDRSADLLLLKEDDRMRFTETGASSRYSFYRVAGPSVDQGTYVEIPVQLLDEGQSIRNDRDVATEWEVFGADTATDYVEVTNGIPSYFPAGNVQGFFTQDIGSVLDPGLPLNTNLYGVDLYSDAYILSEDWDVVAYSGGSGGGAPVEGGQVDEVVAGDNITVDSSDPTAPIVSTTRLPGMGVGTLASIDANSQATLPAGQLRTCVIPVTFPFTTNGVRIEVANSNTVGNFRLGLYFDNAGNIDLVAEGLYVTSSPDTGYRDIFWNTPVALSRGTHYIAFLNQNNAPTNGAQLRYRTVSGGNTFHTFIHGTSGLSVLPAQINKNSGSHDRGIYAELL